MLLPGTVSKRKVTYLDGIILILVGVAALVIANRIRTRLDYRWDWSVIPQYLFRRNEAGRVVPNLLMQGLLTTLRLSVWSSLLALAIGTFTAILLRSAHRATSANIRSTAARRLT